MRTTCLVLALILPVVISHAHAGDLKVRATHAVLEVLDDLGPKFEKATGHRLSYSYDPARVIQRQIEGGAAFDVTVITRTSIEALAKQGKIAAGQTADLGHSGLGVVVRKGAPKPDISTVEAFKQAMLGAKSVIRSTEGNSGLHVEGLLKRLGIEEQMKGKIRLGPSGRVAEFVARGEVELGVQQIPELLPVAGTEFVGPLPAEIQLYTLFAAAAAAQSREPAAARALVEFLTDPAAKSIIRSKGIEPASPRL
jgi:molybdate transport system substrate-binding protein